MDAVNKSLEESGGAKKLFVCGHSLGGALALLYAAEMKAFNPLQIRTGITVKRFYFHARNRAS